MDIAEEGFYARREPIPWTGWVASLALVLVMLFASHSFQFLFADQITEGLAERPTARSNPAYAALFLVQFSLFFVLLFFHMLRNGIRIPLIVAIGFCAYVGSSIFWSISPGTTLAPAVLFSYLVLAAYTTSAFLPPRLFVRHYFFVCAFILTASFILYFVWPEAAGSQRWIELGPFEFEFSGVMASKNYAGIVFASAAILALNGGHIGISNLWRFLVFVMAIVAVFLSNSATAMVIVVALGALSLLIKIFSHNWRALLFGCLVLIAVLIPALPFISVGDVLSIIGRDPTFTGRAALWDGAYSAFPNYPWMGHGYFAFFDAGKFSPAWEFWEDFRFFRADNFHNSSVDILVSLGIVGLVVMLGAIIKAANVVNNQSIDPGARLCLGLVLASFLIGSMMEFAIFHYNYIATFILFYALFAGMWRYGE